MRSSKTLAKIRAGQPAKLCSLGNFIPSYIRQAADFGYDCVWLDLEHRTMTNREVQTLLAFFHQFDVDCLLRAPTLEKTGLYRYLEDGATGLMIPHVSTVERARELVQSVKFPPLGDRGLDGVGFDAGFTFPDAEQFVDHANRETFLVVQIETPQAVENVDAIAAVEGVDGLFVGPGDLGLRLRRFPDVNLTIDEAVKRAAAAAEKHGKFWGIPAGSPDQVAAFRDQGARLIAYGGDFVFLREMMNRFGAELDEIYHTDAS